MDELVFVEETYRMLVCRRCSAAVRPGVAMKHHFNHIHKIKGDLLQEIVFAYGDADLNDPVTAPLPADGSAAVPELPKHRGYRCSQCRYCTTMRDSATRHWRLAGHTADGAAGGVRYTEVPLQSWCKGRYARYWIVQEGGGDGDERGGRSAVASAAPFQLDALLQQGQAELAAEDAARLRKGDAEAGIDRDSAWIKDVGWVQHFGQRDLAAVAEAAQWIRTPGEQAGRGRGQRQQARADDDEEAPTTRRRIEQLGASFCRELERCCLRVDSMPKRTRQLLHNIQPRMAVGTPFRRLAQEASMNRYKLIGQRFLMFCYRAYRLGRAEAEAQWAVRWTDEQWGLFQDVAYAAEEAEEEEKRAAAAAKAAAVEATARRRRSDSGVSDNSSSSGSWTYRSGPAAGASPGGDNVATQALDQACFRFIAACIRDRVGGNVYTNVLLCFCAALGIRQHPPGFSQPIGYTGLLAAILWWSRAFFLEAAFEDEPLELDALSYEALARFDEAHASWLCSGTHSVVDVLLGWMAYGKGHRNQAPGRAAMRWSADRGVLSHNGEAIRIADFQQTVCGLVRQAEQQLDELVGGQGQWTRRLRGSVALARIRDSMAPLGAGQSFATQAANAWLAPGPQTVLRRAAVQSRLWSAREAQWRAAAVRRWLRQLGQFRQQMMALVHIWGGQPGRGPEVTTMRHCDTWQLQRNVYVQDGQVMVVTDRDKMKAIRDVGRKVARFLPARIGQMLVALIAWLLPTERLLTRQCGLPQPADKDLEYLWRNGSTGAWGTGRLSAVLERVFQAGVGVAGIGVMRYRPVAIEMGRQVKGLVLRQLEAAEGGGEGGDEGGDEDGVKIDPVTGEAVAVDGSWNVVWDLQATHGTRIARQHYGVHVGFLNNLQPEMVETYRAISRLWHQFLKKGYEALEAGKTDDTSTKRRRRDAASTSGKRKAAATTNNKREKATTTSNKSKKEASRQQQGRDTKLSYSCSYRDSGQESQPVTYAEITHGLQTLFGASGGWRTVKQEACMRTILGLRQTQSVICVLPTGAGKSILFMLSAVLTQTGTSIVVVPFVALLQDLVQRARDMGVDCIAFETGLGIQERVLRAARLVVVSADVAAGEAFCAYADGLAAAGLLQRIFIDECHTIITDVSYRARLGELRSLHRFERPLVLLTATLPPALEPWLRQEMLVEGAAVVRDRTTKHNVAYRVELVETPARGGRGGREAAVVQRAVTVADALTAAMTAGQKGVLYCRSRQQCEAVAEAMGCRAHHSGMTDVTRRDIREAWAERYGGDGDSRLQWIAATSGLGTGVDIGGIVAVVHVGRPYGLVDFVQQTGRGGRRAGEQVQSVVVWDGRAAYVEATEGQVERVNREAMEAFLETTGCRRAVLGAFTDGVTGETCAAIEGAVWCDRCKETQQWRQTGETAAGSEEEQQWQQQRGQQQREQQQRRRRGVSEAGSSEAGDSEAGDSEAGDSEAGGNETGSSETVHSEAASSEAGSSEAGSSEAGSSEAGSSEAGSSEAASSSKTTYSEEERPLWIRVGREEGRREQLVRWWLEEAEDVCAACHVTQQQYGQVDAEQKTLRAQCRRGQRCETVADMDVAVAKRTVMFPAGACCYRCKLPTDWCEARRSRDGEATGGCRAEDMVTPVILLAMDTGWAGDVLETVAGAEVDLTEDAAFFQWLGQGRRFHGRRGTNGLVLWEALLVTAFQGKVDWIG